LTKIEEDRVTLARTEYKPQGLQSTLSTRRSSFGVYWVYGEATGCMLSEFQSRWGAHWGRAEVAWVLTEYAQKSNPFVSFLRGFGAHSVSAQAALACT